VRYPDFNFNELLAQRINGLLRSAFKRTGMLFGKHLGAG